MNKSNVLCLKKGLNESVIIYSQFIQIIVKQQNKKNGEPSSNHSLPQGCNWARQQSIGTASRTNTIIAEGLDGFDTLVDFDKDDIISLCSTVRKPGGMVVDPNHPNRSISNPGTSIPAITKGRLQLCAYGAGIYQRIGRGVDGMTLLKNRLTEFKYHKEAVDDHDDPDGMPPISKTFGIMKMLEHFPTYLESKLGTSGVALAYYVIRKDAARPNRLPNQVANKPWYVGHKSLVEELIAYAEHAGPTYKTDNATVFCLLQDALAGT